MARKRDSAHSWIYRTSQWKRLRKLVLERDGYRCRIGLDGCTVRADTVDHVMPVSAGGAIFAEENTRAACKHCNSSRGNGRRGRPSRPARMLPSSREW